MHILGSITVDQLTSQYPKAKMKIECTPATEMRMQACMHFHFGVVPIHLLSRTKAYRPRSSGKHLLKRNKGVNAVFRSWPRERMKVTSTCATAASSLMALQPTASHQHWQYLGHKRLKMHAWKQRVHITEDTSVKS